MMITKTALKTPLRYPGGKSRAIKKMAQFFPEMNEYTEFREPFLGGGSVALYVSQVYPQLDIWVNDLYEPLYCFWKTLQLQGDKLTKELQLLIFYLFSLLKMLKSICQNQNVIPFIQGSLFML